MKGTDATVYISSLEELEITLSDDVRHHLAMQYDNLFAGDSTKAYHHLHEILQAMKTPPATTVCRVNLITKTRQEVLDGLKTLVSDSPGLRVWKHGHFDDVVCLGSSIPQDTQKVVEDGCLDDNSTGTTTIQLSSKLGALSNSRVPPPPPPPETMASEKKSLFSTWPGREEKGWPMTHRAIVCDRFCGEAVLRGSDIFVRGVLSADMGISRGETLAVYADVRDPSKEKAVPRGIVLERYTGRCVFLGLGVAECSRSDMFRLSNGLAVRMSQHVQERAGPSLPPLSGILEGYMMLQNLPSVVVGHALDPKPKEVILDMCCAPGGKTAHIASLVRNDAVLVACDKSRKKMMSVKNMFQTVGATCITPLALDSTKCLLVDTETRTVPQIIADALYSKRGDGLLDVKGFPPESFDRILLDPPCSALGLRPKLFVVQDTLNEFKKHATYQRKFISQAVSLLKRGGVMTYSTCTIQVLENEAMIRHILDEYPCMELLPVLPTYFSSMARVGLPGLPGCGLNEEECHLVRRFDPSDKQGDTMGFFVAKFRKKTTNPVA